MHRALPQTHVFYADTHKVCVIQPSMLDIDLQIGVSPVGP
jgi:hypothetical protein